MIIKDEIHGIIEFNETEKRIIDSAPFQRLRRIKQMALAFLVYPGANHTRFEHSLGTCHLSGLIAQKIGVEKDKARLYGLLHDIGHTPFSHDGESALKKIIGDHEKQGREIIEKSEIRDIIEENYTLKEILEYEKKEIVESDLGSDRMDYLQRDAKNTGVAYGIIDSDRIIHKLKIRDNTLMLEEGGLQAAEYLLIARYMMFSAVYCHKTVRIASAMLKKAIESALEEGMDGRAFAQMDDEEALTELSKYPKSAELIRRIKERKLYKEIWRGEEENVEEILKGIEGEYIIDLPPQKYKYVEMLIETKEGVKKIYEISPLIKALKEAEKERNYTIVARS